MNDLISVVELKKVSIMKYNRTILSNVSLSIVQGEFCYIIGPTGSGKTTLLESLYGAADVIGEKAEVLGQDLQVLNQASMPYYRRRLGMIFQGVLLLPQKTVRENYDFVLRATDWHDTAKRKAQIENILERLDRTHLIDKHIETLSGGERQIIGIGRALLNSPKLIIADEPTGHLDKASSDVVMQTLRDVALANGTAVLLSTHDRDLYQRYPSRSYECNDGQLAEI